MNKRADRKNLYKVFLLPCLILCMVVVFGMTALSVRAEGKGDAFFVWLDVLSADETAYEIQVNIENEGKDWEGIVRVVPYESYRKGTAYDTALSLPEGSKKQFIVKIPRISMEDENGTLLVHLLDTKDRVVFEQEFVHLLNGGISALNMGILSDNYSALTYLDMGGNTLHYWSDEYPIRLMELNQMTLSENLEKLQFLVIDEYNTEVLTDEEVAAVGAWCEKGGILLIGTGASVDKTLGGLSYRLVDVESDGTVVQGLDSSQNRYIDSFQWQMLDMVELQYFGTYSYEIMYTTAAVNYNCQNGAVGVLPYSLVELGKLGKDFYDEYWTRDEFIRGILQDLSYMSVASNNYPYRDVKYNVADGMRGMLRAIGGVNSELDFDLLKILVIAYVIVVGPLLYVILKTAKKRELYWVAVPVTVCVGVLLIYFAGRGFEVVNTRAFTVTVENLEDVSKSKSYVYAYDASHEEWMVQIAQGYSYGGKLGYHTYNYSEKEGDYECRVLKEGDHLSIGSVPEQNFEDSYFMLGKSKDSKPMEGSFYGNQVYEDYDKLYGTVNNDTAYDFPYYAVVVDNHLFVLEDLKAGETVDLSRESILYHNADRDNYFQRYRYQFIQDKYYNDKDYDILSGLAALGVGVYHILPETEGTEVVLIGLLSGTTGIIDDNCNELAFKCVYQIQ